MISFSFFAEFLTLQTLVSFCLSLREFVPLPVPHETPYRTPMSASRHWHDFLGYAALEWQTYLQTSFCKMSCMPLYFYLRQRRHHKTLVCHAQPPCEPLQTADWDAEILLGQELLFSTKVDGGSYWAAVFITLWQSSFVTMSLMYLTQWFPTNERPW